MEQKQQSISQPTQNIPGQPPQQNQVPKSPKRNSIPVLSALLAILLTIALIALGEKIMKDLGDLAEKPQYSDYCPKSQTQRTNRYLPESENIFSLPYADETTKKDNCSVHYKKALSSYRIQKIVYKTLFVLPFLIGAVLMIVFVSKESRKKFNALLYPYFISAGIFFARIIAETAWFLATEYGKIAVYILLGVSVVIVSVLIAVVQQKFFQGKFD